VCDAYSAATKCKCKNGCKRTGIDAEIKPLVATLAAATEKNKQHNENNPCAVTVVIAVVVITAATVLCEIKHITPPQGEFPLYNTV